MMMYEIISFVDKQWMRPLTPPVPLPLPIPSSPLSPSPSLPSPPPLLSPLLSTCYLFFCFFSKFEKNGGQTNGRTDRQTGHTLI